MNRPSPHLLCLAPLHVPHLLVNLQIELGYRLPQSNLGVLFVGGKPQVQLNVLQRWVKEGLWQVAHRLGGLLSLLLLPRGEGNAQLIGKREELLGEPQGPHVELGSLGKERILFLWLQCTHSLLA